MNIEPIRLRNGAGNGNPKDGLCLMQAVHWFSGADYLSDRPECASPVLCEMGIWLNDMAPTQAARDSLWPLVWLLLDSRDPTANQARAEHIVREVVHRILASVFDRHAPEHAAALRAANSMPQIQAAAMAVWAAGVAAEEAVRAVWAEGAAGAAGAAARAAEAAEAAARAAVAEAAEAEAVWAVWAAEGGGGEGGGGGGEGGGGGGAEAAARAAEAAVRAAEAAGWRRRRRRRRRRCGRRRRRRRRRRKRHGMNSA